MRKHEKGFTLIELLVVIAIIGILAALVLVALGNARDKANDAAVKSDIGQLRTIAEVIYDTKSASYLSVASCLEAPDDAACGDASTTTSVTTLTADLATKSGNSTFAANSDADQFCISNQLRSGNYVCVDATGVHKESTTADCTATATVVSCP